MAIKITLNKLQLSIAFKELQAYLKNKNIVELDFNHDDLNMLIQLPLQHRDPFDHLIISQAINRGLTILTDDSKFELYPTMLLRA